MLVFVSACSDPSGASKVLRDNGYTNITTTGYRFFACSERDIFSTGFVAKSPNGTTVTGAVCEGLLKGKTIRFD
jgi:hypothetical protein